MRARLEALAAHPRSPWVFGGLLVGLAVVLLVQTLHMAARPQGYDLSGYLEASRALVDGRDPYHTASAFRYVYPLFLALLLVPLAALPSPAPDVLWFALNAAALGWAARRLVDLGRATTGVAWSPRLWFASSVVGLALVDVVQHNLRNGQVNPLVVALCVLAVGAWSRQRRALGVAALAVASAVKLVPLVLLGPLLVRRRGCLAALTVGAFAALVALPWGVRADAWALQADWWASYVGPRVVGDVARARGELWFTLGGALGRVGAGPWAAVLGCGFVGAAVLAVDARYARDRAFDAATLALYLAAIPLVLPISEMHHLLFSAPALLLGSVRWLHGPAAGRAGVGGLVASFFVLGLLGRLWPAGPFLFASTLSALALGGVLVARTEPA